MPVNILLKVSASAPNSSFVPLVTMVSKFPIAASCVASVRSTNGRVTQLDTSRPVPMTSTMANAVLEGQAIHSSLQDEDIEDVEGTEDVTDERYLGPSTLAKIQAAAESEAEAAAEGAEEAFAVARKISRNLAYVDYRKRETKEKERLEKEILREKAHETK